MHPLASRGAGISELEGSRKTTVVLSSGKLVGKRAVSEDLPDAFTLSFAVLAQSTLHPGINSYM